MSDKKEVVVKSYSKKELENLYGTRMRTIKKWLSESEKLKNNKKIFSRKKILPPTLVREIFEFLGEP